MGSNHNTVGPSNRHPHPDQAGVDLLYRFLKIDHSKLHFLSDLLCDGRLYHALPSQLNDPFECRPHFNWPSRPGDVRAIRQHLEKLARESGLSRKDAEKFVRRRMASPGFVNGKIYESAQKVFSEIRICSFSSRKDNLLLWSHYAGAHQGVCIEFDAGQLPISFAFKVEYREEYPEIVYPSPRGAKAFEPALIKSRAWEYEQEFRTLLVADADRQPINDGEAFILSGCEITKVYLGANVSEGDKELVSDMVARGPFEAELWQAEISRSRFQLEFTRVT